MKDRKSELKKVIASNNNMLKNLDKEIELKKFEINKIKSFRRELIEQTEHIQAIIAMNEERRN